MISFLSITIAFPFITYTDKNYWEKIDKFLKKSLKQKKKKKKAIEQKIYKIEEDCENLQNYKNQYFSILEYFFCFLMILLIFKILFFNFSYPEILLQLC